MELTRKDGQFRRQQSAFRDQVSGEPGAKFPAEKDRYHLYVSYACPWAHRTLIVRALKGLEEIIPISVVHYEMLEKGWRFPQEGETVNGSTKDHLYGSSHLRDLYFKADKNYDQRFTVPVLWDKKQETIVNNESSEIMRILNTGFNSILEGDKKEFTTIPDSLLEKIDEVNEWVYHGINNGVYKTGFATTQEAYESNLVPLFDALNRVEAMLSESKGKYLLGNKLTEADIRLYVTIVRFDPAYVQHFKCNLGTIRHNYPYINKWLKNIYWNNPAFKNTTDFEHVCQLVHDSVPMTNEIRSRSTTICRTSRSHRTASTCSAPCLTLSPRMMAR